MRYVYIVMSGEGYGRVLGVFANELDAILAVHKNARVNWGINHKTEPLDFDGSLMRYGWADRCWWQKEVVY